MPTIKTGNALGNALQSANDTVGTAQQIIRQSELDKQRKIDEQRRFELSQRGLDIEDKTQARLQAESEQRVQAAGEALARAKASRKAAQGVLAGQLGFTMGNGEPAPGMVGPPVPKLPAGAQTVIMDAQEALKSGDLDPKTGQTILEWAQGQATAQVMQQKIAAMQAQMGDDLAHNRLDPLGADGSIQETPATAALKQEIAQYGQMLQDVQDKTDWSNPQAAKAAASALDEIQQKYAGMKSKLIGDIAKQRDADEEAMKLKAEASVAPGTQFSAEMGRVADALHMGHLTQAEAFHEANNARARAKGMKPDVRMLGKLEIANPGGVLDPGRPLGPAGQAIIEGVADEQLKGQKFESAGAETLARLRAQTQTLLALGVQASPGQIVNMAMGAEDALKSAPAGDTEAPEAADARKQLQTRELDRIVRGFGIVGDWRKSKPLAYQAYLAGLGLDASEIQQATESERGKNVLKLMAQQDTPDVQWAIDKLQELESAPPKPPAAESQPAVQAGEPWLTHVMAEASGEGKRRGIDSPAFAEGYVAERKKLEQKKSDEAIKTATEQTRKADVRKAQQDGLAIMSEIEALTGQDRDAILGSVAPGMVNFTPEIVTKLQAFLDSLQAEEGAKAARGKP